jgi:hypothetical protein
MQKLDNLISLVMDLKSLKSSFSEKTKKKSQNQDKSLLRKRRCPNLRVYKFKPMINPQNSLKIVNDSLNSQALCLQMALAI